MAPALALLAAHRVLVERHSEQVVVPWLEAKPPAALPCAPLLAFAGKVVVLSLLLEWLSTCSVQLGQRRLQAGVMLVFTIFQNLQQVFRSSDPHAGKQLDK